MLPFQGSKHPEKAWVWANQTNLGMGQTDQTVVSPKCDDLLPKKMTISTNICISGMDAPIGISSRAQSHSSASALAGIVSTRAHLQGPTV